MGMKSLSKDYTLVYFIHHTTLKHRTVTSTPRDDDQNHNVLKTDVMKD